MTTSSLAQEATADEDWPALRRKMSKESQTMSIALGREQAVKVAQM